MSVSHFFYLSAVIFFLSSCQIIFVHPTSTYEKKIELQRNEPIKIENEKNIPKTTKSNEINLAFVGDIIIHQRIRQHEETTREGFRSIWSQIQPYLSSADLTYANLEGPVAPQIAELSGFPFFNYPESLIPELKQSGFDIVSTANNHALDKKSAGLIQTLVNLNKYKLNSTGTIKDPKNLVNYTETWWKIQNVHHLKIAWLSCTEMTNGLKDIKKQVLYCYKDIELIHESIKVLKNQYKVDAIIVLPHWGEEDTYDIEPHRKVWAKKLLDLGATAIIGSHPHVLQQTQDYITQDQRKTFIAYSLGNFVSNQRDVTNKTSMVLYLKLKLNEQQIVDVVDWKYIPIVMQRKNLKSGTSQYRLVTAFSTKGIDSDSFDIWKNQLGLKNQIKSEQEIQQFLQKTD